MTMQNRTQCVIFVMRRQIFTSLHHTEGLKLSKESSFLAMFSDSE